MRRAVARETLAANAASDNVIAGRWRPNRPSTASPLASVAMYSLSSGPEAVLSRVSIWLRLTRVRCVLRCASCTHNELLFDSRTRPDWSTQIKAPAPARTPDGRIADHRGGS